MNNDLIKYSYRLIGFSENLSIIEKDDYKAYEKLKLYLSIHRGWSVIYSTSFTLISKSIISDKSERILFSQGDYYDDIYD